MAISIDELNVNNIVFDEVKKLSAGEVHYQRIPIKYLDELCIATPELMTYRIQENRQKGGEGKMSGVVESYSLPLIMNN